MAKIFSVGVVCSVVFVWYCLIMCRVVHASRALILPTPPLPNPSLSSSHIAYELPQPIMQRRCFSLGHRHIPYPISPTPLHAPPKLLNTSFYETGLNLIDAWHASSALTHPTPPSSRPSPSSYHIPNELPEAIWTRLVVSLSLFCVYL